MNRSLFCSVAIFAPFLIWSATQPSLFSTTEVRSTQFPTDPREAYELDESDVGKWADGPTRLIILEEENNIWDQLKTDEQRRRFIAWFWARRDNNPRDTSHPVKVAFYVGVAEANKRFSDIPRGWKTDRGRVWVIFGKPTLIREDFGGGKLMWNYFAPGMQGILSFDNAAGEFNIYFSRGPQITRAYRIDGGLAPGAWPAYVQRAIQFVRETMVVNRTLEFSPSGN